MNKENIIEKLQNTLKDYNFEINSSFEKALEHYHEMVDDGKIVPRSNQIALDYKKNNSNYKL